MSVDNQTKPEPTKPNLSSTSGQIRCRNCGATSYFGAFQHTLGCVDRVEQTVPELPAESIRPPKSADPSPSKGLQEFSDTKHPIACSNQNGVCLAAQDPEHVCGTGQTIDTTQVNRIEVIDEAGRAYIKGELYGTPVKVELSLQDDGRTLKVFVEERNRKEGE